MKRIGITPCFLYPDVNRKVYGPKTLTYVENNMVEYVVRHGAYPELILELPEELLETQLQQLDGMIFAGGTDVCPETYGEPYLDQQKWPGDLYRDQYEARVFKICKKLELPIYAICRGAQLVNALMGGTLYQDIETETGSNLAHRDAIKYDTIFHPVSFEPGGILASLYAQEKDPMINTVHHQAIKKLAPGLKLEATSPSDGIVEAFSHQDMNEHYILGVQWHPEFSPTIKDKVISDSPLMNHFLKALK